MSYLVLARKYRPQSFDDVVQQEHVTRTLANAIAGERVAHAILFSGPRGTGKTTVARILAKAMNCVQGPTATPCNQCRSCLEITAGGASDVFEIDGASNNSVDQVRELRENLKYMPAHSRFKIYIIDEVHMLSLAAFNALLKTLEEPPEHILFFFATTEIHKIPITILSRCQRHDLRRIDATAIVQHMTTICENESVDIDAPSLHLIAQEAAGSMRDALSLLDHVLACAEGTVSVDMIGTLLGVIDRSHLYEMARAVLAEDLAGVLEGIDAVWKQGLPMKRFYSDLTAYFHNLALLQVENASMQLVDLPDQELAQMRQLAQSTQQSAMTQIVDLLFQAEPTIKRSSQPRIGLELLFVKLFQIRPSLPIDMLIDKVDQLQQKIGQTVGYPAEPPVPDNGATETDDETADAHGSGEAQASSARSEPPSSDSQRSVQDAWRAITDAVAEQKPSLAGFLKQCTLREKDERHVVLEIKGSAFTLKSIQKHRVLVEQVCSEVVGRSISIDIEADIEAVAAKKEQKQLSSRLTQKAMRHPLLMEALEIFDGRVIDIKVP